MPFINKFGGAAPSRGADDSDRLVVVGGRDADTDTMEYITISTTGDVTDFGNLTTTMRFTRGCSDGARGVIGAGQAGYPGGSTVNTIEYITMATTGNATDFGDETVTSYDRSMGASATRGVFGPGVHAGTQLVIDYITIATTGNATDFGDPTVEHSSVGALASATRTVMAGGSSAHGGSFPGAAATIEYVTTDTTGNGTDFGDLTVARLLHNGGCGGTSRGLWHHGNAATTGDKTNVIEYITIASTGNGTDFGDTTVALYNGNGGANATRGITSAGGNAHPAGRSNVIDYVTIASTGNATDFGNLSAVKQDAGACSWQLGVL